MLACSAVSQYIAQTHSSGRGMTLTQTVRESTAVAGLDWVIHYEVRCTFV